MVVERRPFLVLERDHLVAACGRLAGWPGERGRGCSQRGRRQRRRDLLHLDGRAQIVRAGAARYEVLRHDAVRIVGRGPVVAHHWLLHGTPAGRLPLERWWGRGERQATFVASTAATATTAPVTATAFAIVKRGRWQQGQFSGRWQRGRRWRGKRFQVDRRGRRVRRRWPKFPVSGTGGHAVVSIMRMGRLPSAVLRVRRRGRNGAATVVVVTATAAVYGTGHRAHDHVDVLVLQLLLVLLLRPHPPPTAAPSAITRHGSQFVLQQLETHGHHGHADQYVTGRHEHGHILGGLDAAWHQLAEPNGAQAGKTEVRALQQRPPFEFLVDESAQRHVRGDHGQR